ncbi:MAG: phenylalanine--tRNA ligase subunit alpha, partial [bacterium]|nr:phenylalanine--tRNA ligase subunit alpha [bacterium]
MKNKFNQLRDEFMEQLARVKNDEHLKELELKFLSRRGRLSELMGGLKDLNSDLKKEAGELANNVKKELQEKFNAMSKSLNNFTAKNNEIDVTLPGANLTQGHLNPLTLVQNELEDIFSSLGFMILDGPELESDYYNFTALNIPPNHPARDMQDTFYVDYKNKDGQYDLLMRTQTSPVQIRAMQKYGAPLKA